MRSILILAAAAFFYSGRSVADAGLFDAYDLIKQIIGKRESHLCAMESSGNKPHSQLLQ
jgi:Mn2+/Fe2+ NRAMP family transporter